MSKRAHFIPIFGAFSVLCGLSFYDRVISVLSLFMLNSATEIVILMLISRINKSAKWPHAYATEKLSSFADPRHDVVT